MNVTNLDQDLFSVMSQASVSVITTPLVTSVTCASGGTLDFQMPHAKVMNIRRLIPTASACYCYQIQECCTMEHVQC